MRKHLLIGLLFTLFSGVGWSQVSFGVKAGGNLYTLDDVWEAPNAAYNYFISTGAIRYGSNELVNRVRLDSFPNSSSGGFLPIRLEFGAYGSLPLAKRSRLKLEVAYHRLNIGGYGDTDSKILNLKMDQADIEGETFVYTDQTEVALIRSSLQYQYYLGRNSALSLGVSYSMPFMDISGRGSYHLSSIVHPEVGNPIYFQKSDTYERLLLTRKRGMPGANLGYLIKIAGLPKIEFRVTHYFPPINGSDPVRETIRINSIDSTLQYEIQPYEYGIYQFLVFLEL